MPFGLDGNLLILIQGWLNKKVQFRQYTNQLIHMDNKFLGTDVISLKFFQIPQNFHSELNSEKSMGRIGV